MLHLAYHFPNSYFVLGMMPMYRFSTGQKFFPDSPPGPLRAVEPVGLQGYLWFGYNSSLSKVPSKYQNLNLDNLPTTFSPTGFHSIDFEGADRHFKSPLVVFLLCNPQAHILDGQAILSQKNTSITLLSTSPPANKQSIIGNISPDAANLILGITMLNTFDTDRETTQMRIGVLAAQALYPTKPQCFHEFCWEGYVIICKKL